MALSNIKREPRREITEQAFGLLFIAVFIAWCFYAPHLSAKWYHPDFCLGHGADGKCNQVGPSFWGDPAAPLITLGLWIGFWLVIPLWYLVHEIGEMVCGWMTALGLDPRPKQRY